METPLNENNPLRKMPSRPVAPIAADIGSALKEARHKKGHSLEAASLTTRIPKKFLEALEANRLEEIPAEAYLRGFLKNYCDYLETDFEPLWRIVTAASKPAPKAEAVPGGAPSASAPKTPADAPAATSGGLVLGLLAVLALSGLILLSGGSHEGPAPAPAPAPPEALQPLSTSREAVLIVEFKDDAWIRITAEGDVRFEGRVPRGRRQEWKSRQGFEVRIPSPDSVSLTLNGVPFSLKTPDPAGNYRIEAP